jgi:HSP20 family protein
VSDTKTDASGIPPVERVRQEVDRWLDAVRTTGERALDTLGLNAANRPTIPPVDVIELHEEVVVLIDLPGISVERVELSLAGNMLTVSGTRDCHEFAPDAKFHLRERGTGRYNRSIPLPAAVNDDAIRAETRDGLLTVTLRKAAPAPGRSIPISRGGSL